MDLAAVEKLVSGEGWGLLQSLPPYDESSAMQLGHQLRLAGFDPELVAAALTQSRLRARAKGKFGEFAGGMMFTADGLEQATRLELAARHASRFREAGVGHVLDLGCGIGSDAMAFAGLELVVTAVDADEVAAAIAGVNLRHWPSARTLVGTVEDTELPTGDAARHAGAWLDPARRLPGVSDTRGRTRRVFNLQAISPSWDTVQEVARALPATGAKLSPAFPHTALPPGAEAQWTSFGGEVLECAVWWGPLVERAGRSALVLGPDGSASTVSQADSPGPAPTAEGFTGLGQFLYEPDRAVIRAGLVSALTSAVDGVEVDTGLGYVSADRAVELPWARRFVVTEAMPFHVKTLRAWLRERDVGNLTIKKRGVSTDADALRRQLRLTGQAELTVVLTRVAGQQVVLAVRPA
ncbi:THUMP-like domain-containing protein [Oryzihumus sp.]|uniref:THUMP-like domain-containing protein n=1 Tax=Oryzihumus sp. TaxID=1968903 RepID=UPI002ED831E8